MEKKEIVKIITPTKKSKAISVHTRDITQVENTIQVLNKLAIAIKSKLKEGVDYGIIPNCGNKPSLFKSGAQKIALMFQLTARFKKVKDIEDHEKSYVQVEYDCLMYDKKGQFVSQGVGVETSEEKKYKGANPFANINTITKMAKKRAFVDAVVMIGNLSEVFTQDVEDMALKTPIEAQLTKDERLGLYGLTYSKFRTVSPWSENKYKKEQDFKDDVKTFLSKDVFPKLGITKGNLLAFNKSDADKYLSWLKDYGVEVTQGTFKIGE